MLKLCRSLCRYRSAAHSSQFSSKLLQPDKNNCDRNTMSGHRMNRYNAGGAGYGTGFDNYQSGYHNNYNDGEMPYNNIPNDINLLQFVSAMANNFNPPPPPPTRMSCGELRPRHCGMLVELSGRLIKKRVARFAELRDRNNGAAQLVIIEDRYPRTAKRLFHMPENATLTIVGVVNRRPKNSCNQTMPTGDIEVEVQEILNIGFPNTAGQKRPGDKRTYSTMSSQNNCAITSTEYKIAKNENILKYFENRDITCNDLRRDDIGKTVTLVGWVPSAKTAKFMQLKDGYGQTQIIIEDQTMLDTCLSAPENTIIQVTGKVTGRPKPNINLKYETGEIEVMVDSIKILNPEEPYDGPVKQKDQASKLSIDDVDLDNLKQTAPTADTSKFTDRTHTCGDLTTTNIGEKVVICGWLEFQRMGKFFILRDGYGQTQVLLTDKAKGLEKHSDGLALESVVRVEGTVIPRPASTVNEKMKTGHIEVEADKIEVLNMSKRNLPFEVRRFNRAGERLRLTHRYLDLRFTDMQHNLRLRSAVIMRMREYLINYLGFVEVETPTLFRSTPGGAQEFIVPTRKPGHCYSLVQSPQQFKQMLMAGAIDRYFQVARCYRDEATRPDRQPEFTQLDIELSFSTREDIMQLIEEVLLYSWPSDLPRIETPFLRITYNEAMEKYGTDKPDLRFGFELENVTQTIHKNQNFSEKYKNMAAYALVVRGPEINWNPQVRKHFEGLNKEFAGTFFSRKFSGPKDALERLSNLLGPEVATALVQNYSLKENDLLLMGIGEKRETQTLMGRVRLDYYNFLLEHKKVKKSHEYKFAWVIDFPMFEYNSDTKKLESVHHPFTAAHPEDLASLKKASREDLEQIRSQAYDLVLNGQEIGGGSIRIHERGIQEFVLDNILGIPHKHLEHLLTALESGCPPHGGIALGLDRLIAILCRARSIRDVIAFPKSLNGKDPLSDAPIPISEEEKKLYHLQIADGSSGAAPTDYSEEDDDPDFKRDSPSPQPDEPMSTESAPDKSDRINATQEDSDMQSLESQPAEIPVKTRRVANKKN